MKKDRQFVLTELERLCILNKVNTDLIKENSKINDNLIIKTETAIKNWNKQ